MNDDDLMRVLNEIAKQLTLMNASLAALAKVARQEHPEAFKTPGR
jgi:hypothetical protein